MTPARDVDVYGQKPGQVVDFSKAKVGVKTLEDAVLDVNPYQRIDARLGNKETVLRALYNDDFEELRDISNFFYRTSGIYKRLCRLMASLYRYDWCVTPYINDDEKKIQNKAINDFHKVLTELDKFQVKRFFNDVALKIMRRGCYYGYFIKEGTQLGVQELHPKYCRSRFVVNGKPAIEFNMKYFDDCFTDSVQKLKMLNLFPDEFRKGYKLFKQGKLVPDFPGDEQGWYLLDHELAFKFNMDGEDIPPFVSVIPSIIDLSEGQELDRQKIKQRLLKIIVQKLPIDKNGDLIFDIDEATALHNNAVQMIGKAIGLDVLTTFADTKVEDMDNTTAATATDELERLERQVYNEAGISQKLFNTDGNVALEKSILNDEAALTSMILQFEDFLNDVIKSFNKKKAYSFRVQILGTTIYNYKEMAKLYKEQTQLGYSKMLPQIALGNSQSSVLATAFFENEVLELFNVFIPPMSSNTMSSNAAQVQEKEQKTEDEKKGGRKELPDEEKSEKTIQNRESMS